MDKSGGNIGLSCSGTACQKQVVCLSHPYQLAQFAQLSGVDSFRPGKVVTVQIMPLQEARPLSNDTNISVLLVRTSSLRQASEKLPDRSCFSWA